MCGRLLAGIVGLNPTGAWMFVCECFVLSGRGLCDGLITRPEESYRLWCVVVCELETSTMRRPWPTGGCGAKRKNKSLFDVGFRFVAVKMLKLNVTVNKIHSFIH